MQITGLWLEFGRALLVGSLALGRIVGEFDLGVRGRLVYAPEKVPV
jgi:hypothetical protein